MMYRELLRNISLAVAVVFLFSAMLQFNHRRKLPLNYLFAFLFVAGGYHFFYYFLYTSGYLVHMPLLMNTEISATALIGPLFYLYKSEVLADTKKPLTFKLLHFILPLCLLILTLSINVTDSSLVTVYLEQRPLFPDYTVNTWIFILNNLCDLSLAGYFAVALFQLAAIFKNQKVRHESKVVAGFLAILLLNSVLLVIANIAQLKNLILYCIGLFSIAPIYYTLFSFRYPEFAQQVIREVKTLHYKSSITKKYDVKIVRKRLKHLMEEEKLFARETLKLGDLGEALKITSHEVSHLLNSEYGKNFNTFINTYRIREAKDLLVKFPDKSILEVAYLSGFNSKTSFYNFFTRITGVSPVEYRKQKVLSR